MRRPTISGLYVIADTALMADGRRVLQCIEQALRGGATIVQYRNKQPVTAARMSEAAQLRDLCRSQGVPLIINDDITLARVLGADGVHLGREDEVIGSARAALGPAAIIGASCYNELPMAASAKNQGADYLAFGSFFPSPTKPEAVRAGTGLLQQARRRFELPVVAIGGITPENGGALIAAGADALAVISGVFAQADPEAAARRYADLFRNRPRNSGTPGIAAGRGRDGTQKPQ